MQFSALSVPTVDRRFKIGLQCLGQAIQLARREISGESLK
jgi:hypothetical protein